MASVHANYQAAQGLKIAQEMKSATSKMKIGWWYDTLIHWPWHDIFEMHFPNKKNVFKYTDMKIEIMFFKFINSLDGALATSHNLNQSQLSFYSWFQETM